MKRIIILTLLTSTVWSQSVPELGLNEILEATRKKNLTIKQAQISAEVAANSATLANAGLLPRLDLGSSSTILKGTTQTVGGEVDSENTSISAGLNASYTLFNGMQGLTTYQLLSTQTEASELQSGMIEENMLLSTANLYVNVLIRHDQLQIA